MTLFLSIIVGILILGFLVFIHEAAHFFTAKIFKVKVEEFGFGFPPRIWSKKSGETNYSINAIPAGGFVKLLGEEGQNQSDPRSFAAKGPWQRSIIIASGAIVNLLIAALIFVLLLGVGGFRSYFPKAVSVDRPMELSLPFGTETSSVLVVAVDKGSPAENSGIRDFDDVVSGDGQKFESVTQFQNYIQNNLGQPVELKVKNVLDLSYRTITVTPRENPPEGEGALGVVLDPEFNKSVATIDYSSLGEKIFSGPAHAANNLYFQGTAIAALVSQSFEEGTAEPVAENIAGPVGIVALFGFVLGETGISILPIIRIVAIISLILGVINLLPIPAVDGGRLFFTMFEGITRRKVNPNIERLVHTVGFAVLIVLFLVLTFNDISKFFR
jgi:regulator of sigma E protease